MAQLREGSIIKKSTGDEVIATINDIPNVPTKTSELENNSGFITSSAIPTSLPANGGNADTVGGFTVGVNVPADAKFTDTNTTYSEISTAEIDAGASSTLRVITGRRIKYILDKVQGWISSITKVDIGLGNVDNLQQATKVEFNTHNNDAVRHITNTERMAWNSKQDALGYTPLNNSLKGVNGGLAELDSAGKVPSSQLPSYVDDVLEYNSLPNFPLTGEAGKIYVATDANLTYRWSGTSYVEISPSIALGETSSTAFRGDRGKIAYDHSQSTHARADATKVENSTTNGNIKINGVEANVYTHPSGTNPHGTTKSDVELGNVDNIQQATKSEFNSHNADSTRHITSSERTKWNTVDNKVDKVTGKQLSTEDYSIAEKDKLSGIETGANKYTHPDTHPYSMITGTPTSLPASGGQSTTTKHLVGDDTRSVNSPPSVYMSSGSRWAGRAGWQTEFKYRSTIGSPSSLSGTYVYLQTHTPWNDPSGGYPVQIVYGNGAPSWRVGVSNSTWSDWESFNDNGNAATVNGKTVLTDVPANAKFTDTNTTYSEITTAEIDLGTASTLRTITARRVKYILEKVSSMISTAIGALNKSNVGLDNVDNTADSTKNVLSATKLTTAKTINEVSFDGTSNIIIEDSTKEPKFTKNTAFNKNFGTTADTVAQGNDVRLSDARTPLAHNHNTLYNTKTEVSGLLDDKADKTQVLTNVPVNAKFTDTVYTHPSTHPYNMITGTPSSLPANGGNADTVDGKHASDFSAVSHGHNILGTSGSYVWQNNTAPRSFSTGLSVSFVSAETNGFPSYGSVLNIKGLDGAQDGSVGQIFVPYSDGYGGNSFKIRKGNYNNLGWSAWYDLMHEGRINTAQNNTSYTTKQIRNITLSTADPSGGGNGDVWIKYTP